MEVGVRWRGFYQTLVILGWYLTVVRSEDQRDEEGNCTNIVYTDPNKQKEANLVGCPDNQAYFFVVAAAFVGGLVVSYVVLQFIIKCSQLSAPKAKKKDEKKKEEKPKEEKKEKTKEEATTSTGANGGVVATQA